MFFFVVLISVLALTASHIVLLEPWLKCTLIFSSHTNGLFWCSLFHQLTAEFLLSACPAPFDSGHDLHLTSWRQAQLHAGPPHGPLHDAGLRARWPRRSADVRDAPPSPSPSAVSSSPRASLVCFSLRLNASPVLLLLRQSLRCKGIPTGVVFEGDCVYLCDCVYWCACRWGRERKEKVETKKRKEEK